MGVIKLVGVIEAISFTNFRADSFLLSEETMIHLVLHIDKPHLLFNVINIFTYVQTVRISQRIQIQLYYL